QLRDVEVAVAEGDAVGIVELLEERHHALRPAVAVLVAHRVDLALGFLAELPQGADEKRAGGAERQRAGASDALGVDADPESGRQPDLAEALCGVGLDRFDGYRGGRLLLCGCGGKRGEQEQEQRGGEAHGAVPCRCSLPRQTITPSRLQDWRLSRARSTNSRARSSRASVLASQSQNRASSPFTSS